MKCRAGYIARDHSGFDVQKFRSNKRSPIFDNQTLTGSGRDKRGIVFHSSRNIRQRSLDPEPRCSS